MLSFYHLFIHVGVSTDISSVKDKIESLEDQLSHPSLGSLLVLVSSSHKALHQDTTGFRMLGLDMLTWSTVT